MVAELKQVKITAKTRGLWLSIWLIFLTLIYAYSVYGNWNAYDEWMVQHQVATRTYPYGTAAWIPPAFIFLAVISLIGVVLVWLWKKWGFYLLVAVTIAAFLLNIIRGVGVGQALIGLIGVGILYMLIQPKWSSFD
jgi:hypothetical protein